MRAIIYGSLIIVLVTVMLGDPQVAQAESGGALVAVEAEEEDGVVELEDGDVEEPDLPDFSDPDVEPFIPTKEWEEVKPGQSIPAGLHVQLNMATGRREAKLMEGDDGSKYASALKNENPKDPDRLKKMKKAIEDAVNDFNVGQSSKSEPLQYWTDGSKQGMANLKKDSFTRAELKEALKKFKTSKPSSENQATSIEGKFRSAAELKDEMAALKLSMKSDPEIMKELLDQYHRDDITLDNKISIFTDLEYYVHQIDNAMDFTNMGGLRLAISELNSTQIPLQCEAAFVLASAVQSNPKVQVEAIESGALHQLLKLLSTQTDERLQNKVIHAISALLRGFPYAQQKFIELGGAQTLTQILAGGSTKLKVKVMTLINDLITEKIEADELGMNSMSETVKLKVLQYSQIHLDKIIREHGWCQDVLELLHLSEHDSRDKVLTAISTMMPMCQDIFVTGLQTLKSLQSEYKVEADVEQTDGDEDFFFRDLLARILDIIDKLEFYKKRDEL